MSKVNYKIPAGEEILACTVDYATEESVPSVICLHGGGPGGKDSTEYLATALQKRGHSVISFDFSGQGTSTGEMGKSSLKKRLLETKSILGYFGVSDKISSVIGTSMGGYIACALAKEISIANLIFFGPAAYTTKAWDVEFAAGFTEIIRAENSFLDSDIQVLLSYFSGNALYIIGENDAIIPQKVVGLYHDALAHCRVFETYTIMDCPHPIHRWIIKRPAVKKKVVEKVLNSVG